MSGQRVAIIGAGAAGLATGCYLQINGFSTTIYEMGDMCGGVAVSWRRKGFVFDGATNWLPGSSPTLNMHRILAELIDFSKMPVADFDEFMQIQTQKGTLLRVFTDADRLREEMVRISPHDKSPIDDFTRAIKQVAHLPLPLEKSPEICSLPQLLGIFAGNLPLMLFFLKWHRISIREYSERFRSQELAEAFRLIFPRHDFFSVLSVIWALGWMNMRSAGYPLGGSEKFIGMLEERYRSLGGNIVFNARATGLEIDGGIARGVKFDDHNSIRADYIVSTADGHETLFAMLGNSYLTSSLKNRFERLRLFPGMIQVSYGVNRSFVGEPHKVVLPFVTPLTLGSDRDIPYVMVRICNNDASFAPAGKTALVAHIRTHDPDYWSDLRKRDMARYREEKDFCNQAVVCALEKRYPGIREQIEVVDVATPATYVRYTNVWHGSYQGWAPTPTVIGKSMKKRLPGLKNFYMAGQWVEPPGGLPRVILSGRNVAQVICSDAGTPFRIPS